ncbi:MAG: molybdopterin-dependent oxidoreductase, partial [Deltaproteobacteria bacterium]|nr:molybdopterin-dependent oxidoreductase [Deltaproteobacteria bacterium]
ACDASKAQVEAMERMEFVVTMHSRITPTASYADIILPARDWMWEEKNITQSQYGGFESINYCPGVVEPPGEVRPWVWVYTKLAGKLGIEPKRFFKYYTTDESWDRDWERYLRDCYHVIESYYRERNKQVPSWEDFTKGRFINCDELDDEPFTGWDEQIKQGKPFKTGSGRIELYSTYIADRANRGKGTHYDSFGRLYDNLPSDWGDLTPSAVYRSPVRGMDDPLVKRYPLMLVCPHCRYLVHYLFWDHPWLRGHLYQHRIWISPADAKARGVKDGDLVEAYNDRGRVIMAAYVTSRMMPGVVAIRHGGKFIPHRSGADIGGSPSTLLGGDFESCITPAKASGLVQVRRFRGTLE